MKRPSRGFRRCVLHSYLAECKELLFPVAPSLMCRFPLLFCSQTPSTFSMAGGRRRRTALDVADAHRAACYATCFLVAPGQPKGVRPSVDGAQHDHHGPDSLLPRAGGPHRDVSARAGSRR